MSKKAGGLVIEITAGTARAIVDIDNLGGKVRQFGRTVNETNKQMVSGLQANSAFLREMEGNFGHNIRAVENFMTKTLGLGNALKAVFPIVGGLAFGGLLVDLGKKLYDFYAGVRNGPEIMRGAFAELHASAQVANDEMKLSTDRIQDQINKLEGKPSNRLQEAIDAAVLSSDKLGESLSRSNQQLFKLMNDKSPSMISTFLNGMDSKDGLQAKSEDGWAMRLGKKLARGTVAVGMNWAQMDAAKKLIGGYQGTGGLVDQGRSLDEEVRGRIVAAKSEKEAEAVRVEGATRRLDLLGKEKVVLEAIRSLSHDDSTREILTNALHDVADQTLAVQETSKRDAAQARLTHDQAALANAKIGRPIQDNLNALASHLQATLLRQHAAASTDPAARAAAMGQAEALIKAQATVKALEKTHGKLQQVDKDAFAALETGIQNADALLQWTNKTRAFGEALDIRTAAQNRLTAAVGKGYEAEAAAQAQDQLQQFMGERYNDPKFAADQAAAKAKIDANIAAAHRTQMSEAIDRLGDELTMTQAVTAAVTSGAYAIRLATEAERERQALDKTHDPAVVAAMRKQFDADEAENAAESAEKIRQETTAIKARTDATWQGAMAQRAAELQAKYAQMGAAAGPNADAVVAAEKQKDIAQLQGEIATQASRAGMAYQSSMEFLNREFVYLQRQGAATKETLAYQISLRSVEDERLKLAAAYALEQRTALAGVRSFFLEMQMQAESSAKIIYDALNRALDDTSANLAKMLTGQKASWGEMFRSIGQQMVQSSMKSMLQQGLGQLGKMLGINIPGMGDKGGKPGDSPDNPIYTSDVNAGKGGGSGFESLGTLDQAMSGTSSGGSSGGGFANALGTLMEYGGGMASGGFTSPDKAYMVGEEGPEMLTRTSGYVTRKSELSRMIGSNAGGGDTIHIDARGTDPALTEARVKRAMKETHSASVGTSMKTAHEQAARRPKK